MSNEIVKYDNELNHVPFRKFNNREFNIFFSLVSRLRDKGTRKVSFSFEEIRDISNYKQHGSTFINDLEQVYTKMLNLKIWRKENHVTEAWVLFTYYKIDENNRTITVAVNPDMKHIINHLAQWTRFSLKQFIELKSTYSKTAFRLLKQFRVVGHYSFNMDEFRALLDIPKSYGTGNIDKRVLKPIRSELSGYFKGLAVRKIYKGRGKKVVGYSFSWKPESNDSNDFSKGDKIDNQRKIDNIKFNSELNDEDKENAINKIKGINYSKKNKKSKEYSIMDDPNFQKDFDKYFNM